MVGAPGAVLEMRGPASGALPVCERSLLRKQAALRTGPWPGLNEAKC